VSANVDDLISMPPVPASRLWERLPHVPELAKSLVAAQKTAKAVSKDARNSFHGYNYASAENIIDEARGALSDAGLAVMPLSVERDPEQPDHVWESGTDDKGKPTSWIVTPRRIRCTYLLLHESGQCIPFYSSTPVIPEKGRPEDKAEFGSRTENLGYAMRDLLLLPRGTEGASVPSGRNDTDKDVRGPKQSSRPPSRQQAEQATQELDGVLRLTRLLSGPSPDGLGWATPKCKNWLRKYFHVDASSQLTDKQMADAIALGETHVKEGELAYRAALKIFHAEGRVHDGEAA
jgi:hypothetical protein